MFPMCKQPLFVQKTKNFWWKIEMVAMTMKGCLMWLHSQPLFILDMFNLRSIQIDMKTETAWVETGATLGEVYYIIDEKSKIHAFQVGVWSTVGVGGHISGGGYGNMMRKYGLWVDNVVDALMVDVEGKLFDRKSMGEDLFWAITGGGEASFGVVLAYKIKLVWVPKTVIVFRVLKTLEQNSTDIVYNWHHFAPTINNNLFITLVLNVTQNGIKTIRETFVALFLGDSKSLVSLLNDKFSQLGLKQSDCIETSWLGSVLFSKNTNITALVEVFLNRQPQSVNYLKRKYHYVKKSISKEGLEGIWRKMIELVDTSLNFNPYGGRMAKIPSTTSHFPHRAGNLWKIQYLANWNKPGKEVANHYINLTRKLHKYMTHFVSKNPRGAFFNYRDLHLWSNNCNGKNSYAKGKVYGVKYFKDNFNRLVQIRTKVDPDNFFIVEQSIPMLSYHKLLE